jgi:hypothetical protein
MSEKPLDSLIPADHAAATKGTPEHRRQEALLKTGALQNAIRGFKFEVQRLT